MTSKARQDASDIGIVLHIQYLKFSNLLPNFVIITA
jgi:hypothetical protein